MNRVKNLIKLTNLNSKSLNEKEQNLVIAGGDCYCGCYYADCGGSSEALNRQANDQGDLMSTTPGEGSWCYAP